ncbi:hypothetical protein AB0M54_39700 [Actinoplanes sp. NPDC051470]|uniref:hypothetical protein n=1 Tax=unclassified Actinoplanes TaxID=2626549 RepID=UPI0034376BF2
MRGFVEAAISFPTVVFTPLLIVVIGYWIVVIAGGADPDTDVDSGEAGDGPLAFVGLSGVPMSVVFSLLVLFAWFGSLAGAELLTIPLWIVLVAALVAAFIITRVLVALLARVWPNGPSASRADFIGLTCVIRTGTVTRTFGQAEVHAPDGSSAIVQVRQTGADTLTAGSRALLYDVDVEGEFFWVVPADVALRPDEPENPR